jgi:hypothetical protein
MEEDRSFSHDALIDNSVREVSRLLGKDASYLPISFQKRLRLGIIV